MTYEMFLLVWGRWILNHDPNAENINDLANALSNDYLEYLQIWEWAKELKGN